MIRRDSFVCCNIFNYQANVIAKTEYQASREISTNFCFFKSTWYVLKFIHTSFFILNSC